MTRLLSEAPIAQYHEAGYPAPILIIGEDAEPAAQGRAAGLIR